MGYRHWTNLRRPISHKRSTSPSARHWIYLITVSKIVSAIRINSCIYRPFSISATLQCREVRHGYCLPTSSDSRVAVRWLQTPAYSTPFSPYNKPSKLMGFSVGSKLQRLHGRFLAVLRRPASSPPSMRKPALAVAKLLHFVNTLYRRANKMYASNHELHGMVQRFQPRK